MRMIAPAALTLAALLLATVPAMADGAGPRMNEVQVIGTHNSYKRELAGAELAAQQGIDPGAANLAYSHAPIRQQFDGQGVRGLELDLFPDPEGGTYAHPLVRRLAGGPPLTGMGEPGVKVLHIADVDYATTCATLQLCLAEVRAFSQANPDHAPIPILLELKSTDDRVEAAGGAVSVPWDRTQLDALDAEIRAVFDDDDMITPDDVRGDAATLEAAVLDRGWPALDDARGQVLFLLDNDPGEIRDAYRAGRDALEGAVLFTNSRAGQPDAAFVKRNEPLTQSAEITDLVERGYYVRTRSDVPVTTVVADDPAMRDAAFTSGAQIVSTDFPVPGMAARYGSDFVAALPGGGELRANPVNGG